MTNQQLTFEFELKIKFNQYHHDNPEIYKVFKSYALRAVKLKSHFGAKAIFEIIRWNTEISGNDEFKINNNYTALYARLFENEYPQHTGFFRKRKSKFD